VLYQSPADFCAEYASAHSHDEIDEAGVFGQKSTLDAMTVVGETPDSARVEALWYTCGHDPDSGYYEVFERIAFVLVKRHDGWYLQSEENLGYE
jgi:ketosteroid isomerase-like protein